MTDRVETSIDASGVGWITLHNPDKLNAISVAMWQQLGAALTQFEQDASVRCVVLTGQGDKAFCVGADISQGSYSSGPSGLAEYDALVKRTLGQLQGFPKPTLAMVQGFCIGAGVALASACDIRVAAATARFGIPVAKLGIAYVFEGVQRLVTLMGPAQAKRLLYTGERYPADEMLRAGLVDEVAWDVVSRVRELAHTIAANAPLSTVAAKYAVDTLSADGRAPDVAGCAARARACYESEDHAEGQRAFRERRAPVFRGR